MKSKEGQSVRFANAKLFLSRVTSIIFAPFDFHDLHHHYSTLCSEFLLLTKSQCKTKYYQIAFFFFPIKAINMILVRMAIRIK